MISSPAAPTSRPPAAWLLPDGFAEAGAEFAVEWQVVERMEQFPLLPMVEGRELS